jgi:MOSC domain
LGLNPDDTKAMVIAVSSCDDHHFSKIPKVHITLLAHLGVEGDAHCGVTVKHRSRVVVDPTQPNLRQVHLIHAELFDELRTKGFLLNPGDLGENILTRGIALLDLPRGARLNFTSGAIVEITGLRNPCSQIEKYKIGLLAAVLDKTADGILVRKSGVMGIVITGGSVTQGDEIKIELPAEPHLPLERV